MRTFSCAWLALLLLAGVANAQSPTNAPRLAELRALLEQQRQELHIAGLAFVAVKDGQVIALDALGWRDVDKKLPATPDTLFPIGSCTKAFTGIAAAIAADEGRLSLDESPHRLLPWFRMADARSDALVTLRDLLAHRTGLKAYADLAAEPGVLTREEYVRAATAARPVAKLRERFLYSNAMITAAGLAIGKAWGLTWEEVIARKLFAPLRMTASRTSPFFQGGEHAVGYAWEGDTWKPREPPRSLIPMGPAGAIVSTARDLSQWLLFLTAGGVGPEGRRLLSEATLRDATRPHIAIDNQRAYALGWATYDWAGHAVVEHNGGSQGISALMGFIPEKKVGFAILANASPTSLTAVGSFAKRIWPLLLGAPAESGSASAPPVDSSPPPAPADLPSADALIARALQAHGGEEVLRRHGVVELRGRKRYENQGVEAQLSSSIGPGRRTDDECWFAAGKPVGRVRVFYDADGGGQRTTFGQDATYGPAELAVLRRNGALHPLLELGAYEAVRVDRKVTVDGEDAYVLVLEPATGKPTALFVSARTGLIVRREQGTEAITYGDFRTIDGERFPFRSWIEEPLGEVSVEVTALSFGKKPPSPRCPPPPGRKGRALPSKQPPR